MTIVIRAGLVVIAILSIAIIRSEFFVPKSIDCRTSVAWPALAPHGALWPQEVIHWDQPPDGYTALVGWVNAATAIPCFDETAPRPLVEIRRFSIIAIGQSGEEEVIETIDPRDTTRFVGRLFPRVPRWFGETEGKNEAEITVGGEDGVTLLLDQVPLRVYHAWTEPRTTLDSEKRYLIEIEARISDTARLQIGLDYWRDTTSDYAGWDPSCVQSTNCEGFVSNWFGSTDGDFQIFRAPGYPAPTTISAPTSEALPE